MPDVFFSLSAIPNLREPYASFNSFGKSRRCREIKLNCARKRENKWYSIIHFNKKKKKESFTGKAPKMVGARKKTQQILANRKGHPISLAKKFSYDP